MATESVNRANRYLKNFTQMKTIPSVATRLVTMIERDRSSLQEFEEVIKVDPTLVLRLLKLVNSAYFALRTNIKTITEALVYIGMDNLRNMIVLDALKNLFVNNPESDRFSREKLWLHCAVTSICCQMIAERIFVLKGENAFLCGFLHDIGLIVEDQAAPTKFSQLCETLDPDSVDMTAHEEGIMGTTHAVVGHLLSEKWGLNADICEAIKLHHTSLNQVATDSLAGILQISEYLIYKMDYTAFPDIPGKLSPPLMNHVKRNIVAYQAIIDDLPQEIGRAKEIYSLEDIEYGQAV